MARWICCWIILFSSLVFADPNQLLPSGKLAYYGSFNPRIPAFDLKQELARILSSRHCHTKGESDAFNSCPAGARTYQHTPIGYSQARVVMFGELFRQEDREGTYVLEVYCQNKVYFNDPRSISRMHDVVNIEHTWPQSRFSTRFDKELQKSDLHHLFPSDSKANSVRGNHEFGEADAGFIGQDLCKESTIDQQRGDYVFTPPASHRGNVARALFYFSTRYDLPISAEEERVLRTWHAADPVDNAEKARNNLIAKHQLIRNPFIDFPELVSAIKNF